MLKHLLVIGFLSHALLWGGVFADLMTTHVGLQNGAREVNPLIPSGFKGQVVYQAAFGAAIELMTWRMRKDGYPVMAVGTRIAFAGAKYGAAAWNYHATEQHLQLSRVSNTR